MSKQLRQSQAAVALIHEESGPAARCLVQWSDTWRALHFVGGHRDGDESYRECMLREIEEELHICRDVDFRTAAEPLAHLKYVAYSENARRDTAYEIAVFLVEIAQATRPQVDADAANEWISLADVPRLHTKGGRRISPTVPLILNKLWAMNVLPAWEREWKIGS